MYRTDKKKNVRVYRCAIVVTTQATAVWGERSQRDYEYRGKYSTNRLPIIAKSGANPYIGVLVALTLLLWSMFENYDGSAKGKEAHSDE